MTIIQKIKQWFQPVRTDRPVAVAPKRPSTEWQEWATIFTNLESGDHFYVRPSLTISARSAARYYAMKLGRKFVVNSLVHKTKVTRVR